MSVSQIKRTWQETRRAASAFEEMGFDSLWVNDHLYGPQSPAIPMLEAWTLAAGIAAVTEKPEIGTLVTPVGMRNPAHTGKMIATVDNIAGGRIIPGFGSGWMAREFSDFGMPFVGTRDRVRQLGEGLQIFRGMFDPDQEEFSFEGEFFHAENLVTQPKPRATCRSSSSSASGSPCASPRGTPTSGTTPPAPRTTSNTK
ncbi:MAG: LLM class flavin-dependent oxidoreductase [Chloroflexi bacterium]|nr:LLM class flavin-dependent oxidoreductase [Chloroflexota bacterium]